jgi:hypothetical protein
MIWMILMIVASVLCAQALVMALINLRIYRRTDPRAASGDPAPLVSVCIPARNEERNIEAVVRCVLGQDHPRVEVVVCDDDSTDATPAILARLAAEDSRIRLAPHAPLPPGWVGKQHACARAAAAATGDWMLFTDADVRFAPDCLRRTVAEAHRLGADMVSTFPRQITGTLGEALVVPMIHFILFSYLPMPRMRRSLDPASSAGCGQFLMITRHAYDTIGGHAAWKDSMHDGIRMPRAVRRAGLRSDLFDGTDLCSCRMYTGWAQTWRGFVKNAYEGLGSVGLLAFVTVLHALGHLAPWVYLGLWAGGLADSRGAIPAGVAIAIALTERAILARRFRQSAIGILLHPVGIALMTAIQWASLVAHLRGTRSWKGRTGAGAPAMP